MALFHDEITFFFISGSILYSEIYFDINVVILVLLWLMSARYTIFYPFTFNVCLYI